MIVLFSSRGFSAVNEADFLSFTGQYELIESDDLNNCAQTIEVSIGRRGIVVRYLGGQWGSIFFSDINQGKKEKYKAFAVGEGGAQSTENTTLSGNNGCLELKYSFRYKDPYASCSQTTSFTLDVNSGALSYKHRDCHTDRLPLGSETLWRWFTKQHDYPYEPQNFDGDCLYGKVGRENADAKLKKCSMVSHNERQGGP